MEKIRTFSVQKHNILLEVYFYFCAIKAKPFNGRCSSKQNIQSPNALNGVKDTGEIPVIDTKAEVFQRLKFITL